MKFGIAKEILNWPIGLPMAGYSARTGLSTGTHDQLVTRALVATDSYRTAVLLSIDTVAVDAVFSTALRSMLVSRFDLDPAAIMITATHTHSAPGGTARFSVLGGSEAFMGIYSPERTQALLDACFEAVCRALTQQVPVRLSVGTGHAYTIGLNRRDMSGPSDPSVAFLHAVDSDGETVARIYSFACHPTLLDAHNTLYSGDLAGVTATKIETAQGGIAFPITGTAGDISTRFSRRESSFNELDRLADLLADGMIVPESPDDDESVAFALTHLTLPLKPVPSAELLTKALTEAQVQLAGTPPEGRRLVESEIEGYQVALAAGPRPDSLPTEVQTLRLGKTLIVGFPGELFARFGMAAREQLAPYHVLVAGYANDYIGYVPTPESTSGYEATSAVVTERAGQALLNTAVLTARQCLTNR